MGIMIQADSYPKGKKMQRNLRNFIILLISDEKLSWSRHLLYLLRQESKKSGDEHFCILPPLKNRSPVERGKTYYR